MNLTDAIHLLQIDFEISLAQGKKLPRFVNVPLIFADKITLIDTGVKGIENVIFDYIKKQGSEVPEIDSIILSHAHPDHIGSAATIKEQTGCRVIAHPLERAWMEDIERQNRERPVPGFFDLVDRPVTIDHFVEDNQIMNIHENLIMKFIESPGHSMGSLNMLFIEDRILFTADSIPLKGDIPTYDDYGQLMQSLEKIRTNEGFDVLLTSWTPPITGRQEAERLIDEGEVYMRPIDEVVRECYHLDEGDLLDSCRHTVKKLRLPPFLVNTLVDKAFSSHLK
jgi:glyoxylase-like metal-dependent hydrolase (beta-lactamase superfamily II)